MKSLSGVEGKAVTERSSGVQGGGLGPEADAEREAGAWCSQEKGRRRLETSGPQWEEPEPELSGEVPASHAAHPGSTLSTEPGRTPEHCCHDLLPKRQQNPRGDAP